MSNCAPIPSISSNPTFWSRRCKAWRCSTTPTGCGSTTALFKHAEAVRNTLVAVRGGQESRRAARSCTSASPTPRKTSPLEYFSGKARLERALIESGCPTPSCGRRCCSARKTSSSTTSPGRCAGCRSSASLATGDTGLQPIYVDDLAELAVEQGPSGENAIIDAIGPETFTYRELVETIGRLIGVRRPIVSMPPRLGYWAGKLIGALVGDVVITREEIAGLMANLLYVNSPPAGSTKLTDWIKQNANTLGRHYTSELARRMNRQQAYQSN